MDMEDDVRISKPEISWIYGHEKIKPWSIVQSTIFCELHGCANKLQFDPLALKLKQLQKSRALVKIRRRRKKADDEDEQEEEDKTVNHANHENQENIHRVVKTKFSQKRSIYPHLEFGSGPSNAIDLIDGKIVYRLKKETYEFFNIEPHLMKSMKKIFCMNGTWETQFGKYDVAYLSDGFPANSFNDSTEKKYSYRATLFLVPPKEKVLRLYSLVNGELLRKVSLGLNFYNEIVCQENGKVLLHGKKSSLPSDVEQDYLLFSYPPLNLDAHIQIKKGALKKYRIKSLEIWDDYIVGKCSGNFILLFDLEKELESAKILDPTSKEIEDEAIMLTHIIYEFKTPPLLNVRTIDDFLAFSPNHGSHYIIKTSKECFELRQFTDNQSSISSTFLLQKMHLPTTSLDHETPVTFLRNYGPRIMINHGATIRIFGVSDNIEKKFELLFNRSFVHSTTGKEKPSPLTPSSRFGLRDRKARISYENDQDLQIDTAENETLMQLAIVRFAVGSIECSIFDSLHYNHLYSLNPHAFNPKKDEIYNQIFVFFYDDFVAVKQHAISNGGERKIYTFNLLRGLE